MKVAQILTLLAIVVSISYGIQLLELPITINDTFRALTLTLVCISFVPIMVQKRSTIKL
jgi:hypothetical protein